MGQRLPVSDLIGVGLTPNYALGKTSTAASAFAGRISRPRLRSTKSSSIWGPRADTKDRLTTTVAAKAQIAAAWLELGGIIGKESAFHAMPVTKRCRGLT